MDTYRHVILKINTDRSISNKKKVWYYENTGSVNYVFFS